MLELEESFIDREIEAQRGKVTWLMSYGFLFCGMTHWVLYRNFLYDRLCKKIKGIKKNGRPLEVVQKEHWAWSLHSQRIHKNLIHGHI